MILGILLKKKSKKNQLIKDGIFYFNNERFWECHEAFEGAWKQCTGDEKELIQGLILVAAALVHLSERRRYNMSFSAWPCTKKITKQIR